MGSDVKCDDEAIFLEVDSDIESYQVTHRKAWPKDDLVSCIVEDGKVIRKGAVVVLGSRHVELEPKMIRTCGQSTQGVCTPPAE